MNDDLKNQKISITKKGCIEAKKISSKMKKMGIKVSELQSILEAAQECHIK